MSELKARLEFAKIAAMKARGAAEGDEKVAADLELSTVRAALTAVSKAETSTKERQSLNDDAVVAVLRKEIKQREDAATVYADAGETARAEKETAEAEVLRKFVPQLLDEDATRTLVRSVVTENGVTDMKGMGVVMKALNGRTDIDKGLASKIVRELIG